MIDFLLSPDVIIIGVCLMLISLTTPFLIAVGLALAVALSPELPLMGLPIRIGDFVLLWGVVVLILRQIFLHKHGTASLPLLHQGPWIALLAVELIATLVGALMGTARLDLTKYSGLVFFCKSLEMFMLYLVVIKLLDTPAKVRAYVWVLLVSGALLGMYGMYTHAQGGDISMPVEDVGRGAGSYSLLATALITPLVLGLSFCVTGGDRVRWVSAVLLVPMVYSLLFSVSRQTYFGVAVMFVFVLMLQSRHLLFAGSSILLLLILWAPGLFLTVLPEHIVERVLPLTYPFVGRIGGLEYPTYADWEYGIYTVRIRPWQAYIPRILNTNPITGLGLAALPPGWLESQYLLVVYYTGFVGLIVFLRLLILFGREGWRLYKAGPDWQGRALGLAGLGAVVGMAAAGVGGMPLVAVRSRELFWLLMACMAAYVAHMNQGYEEPAHHS